jgi:hypothetical protein
MIIAICSAVFLCCIICGCLIFKKYKKHKQEQEHPNDINNLPQFFNTGQLRPFTSVPNFSNRESTGYIHPFDYPYPSNYRYNVQDNTTDQVVEVRENPEKISRQLSFNTPVKSKRIYKDDQRINFSSARINYPKSDMTCKYISRIPEDYYSSFGHSFNNKTNPRIEPDGSYITSDVEREFRLNADNMQDICDRNSYYVRTSPIRRYQTHNSQAFNNENNFYSPIKRRMMTEISNDCRTFNNNNYEHGDHLSQMMNAEVINEGYNDSRLNRPRSKIIKTPIKSFLKKRQNY